MTTGISISGLEDDTVDVDPSLLSDNTIQQQHDGIPRKGTVWSARLSLLSSMVGGGSLSLPYAFTLAGNAFFAPLLLLLIAFSAEFSILALTKSSRRSNSTSYESLSKAAFGPLGKTFGMIIISVNCFFATTGYAVLLRDLAEPIADILETYHPSLSSSSSKPSLASNIVMMSVILIITPLTTLRTLTALKHVSLFSMISITILSLIIAYRSIQCNVLSSSSSPRDYLTFTPTSPKVFLTSLPLFINCFICHFNVISIQNELQNPSPSNVNYLIRSTIVSSCVLYLFVGFAGSMYGNCTPTKTVQGNILLDFRDDDALMGFGRLCFGVTIAFAFPMLVIPGRDIVLRLWEERRQTRIGRTKKKVVGLDLEDDDTMEQPLLLDQSLLVSSNATLTTASSSSMTTTNEVSFIPPTTTTEQPKSMLSSNPKTRIVTAIVLFWSSAILACLVQSVDIVWDLLGSSVTIVLGFLIPIGCYLILCKDDDETKKWNRGIGWVLIVLYGVSMVICTVNSVSMTFFAGDQKKV